MYPKASELSFGSALSVLNKFIRKVRVGNTRKAPCLRMATATGIIGISDCGGIRKNIRANVKSERTEVA